MSYLETLLTQALSEIQSVKAAERAAGYHEGYEAAQRFYTQPNPYLPVGCKGTEVPKKAWESPQPQVGVTKTDFSDRLVAYFEKRAKENYKRAVKEENLGNIQAERSGYYFSGKADSYERAADKVRELLGEPPTPTTCTRKSPHVCTESGPCNGYPALNLNDYGIYETPEKTEHWEWRYAKTKPEQWITEFRTKGKERAWKRSGNEGLNGIFNSEKEAQAAVDADAPRSMTIVRRVRRID